MSNSSKTARAVQGQHVKNSYQKSKDKMLSYGNYIPFCLNLLPKLELVELTALQIIINAACFAESEGGVKDGWFQFTDSQLLTKLKGKCSRSTTARSVRRLEEMGFIKFKRMGIGGHRHVQVDMSKVIKAVAEGGALSEKSDSKRGELSNSKRGPFKSGFGCVKLTQPKRVRTCQIDATGCVKLTQPILYKVLVLKKPPYTPLKPGGTGCATQPNLLSARQPTRHQSLRATSPLSNTTSPHPILACAAEPKRTEQTNVTSSVLAHVESTSLKTISPASKSDHTLEDKAMPRKPEGRAASKSDHTLEATLAPQTSPAAPVWASRIARRLKTFISDVMRFRGIAWSQTAWTREINKLKAKCGGGEEAEASIEKVLDWYEGNWKRVAIRVQSASSFCNRYTALCELMERLPDQSKLKQVEIPDDLRDIDWPNGEPENLKAAYVDALRGAERLIAAAAKLTGDERALADHLIEMLGTYPEPMAIRWIRWTATSVKGWRGWSGSFKGKELNPSSALFYARLNDCAKGYVLSSTVQPTIRLLEAHW